MEKPETPTTTARTRRWRSRAAALTLTALSLSGTAVLASAQPAHAAPPCAAPWAVFEGRWHTASGWPASLAVSCDANGNADWVWSTLYIEPQHFHQWGWDGLWWLGRENPSGSVTIIMADNNDPNHLTVTGTETTGQRTITDLYRG